MKKKIAIMLTLILATGTFTACTAEEKMDNSSLSPTVSTSVGVSVSGETSATATTEKTTETTTAEKTTVLKETEPSGQNTKTEEKADSGQNSAVVSATNPIQKTQSEVQNNSKNTVNSNQSESESTAKKETETPTQKSAVKLTQPPNKAKTVDVHYAVSACIAHGQQLGMKCDSSLNTGNASWFSPTNASYYDDTQSLTADCYGDVEYVAYYFQSSGIAPRDLSFNVIAENNKIYVVYC
jgi:cytoskeletal protein RodZ